MAERRIDPFDGNHYTYEEIVQFYAGKYSETELRIYWDESCYPAPLPENSSSGDRDSVSEDTADEAATAASSARPATQVGLVIGGAGQSGRGQLQRMGTLGALEQRVDAEIMANRASRPLTVQEQVEIQTRAQENQRRQGENRRSRIEMERNQQETMNEWQRAVQRIQLSNGARAEGTTETAAADPAGPAALVAASMPIADAADLDAPVHVTDAESDRFPNEAHTMAADRRPTTEVVAVAAALGVSEAGATSAHSIDSRQVQRPDVSVSAAPGPVPPQVAKEQPNSEAELSRGDTGPQLAPEPVEREWAAKVEELTAQVCSLEKELSEHKDVKAKLDEQMAVSAELRKEIARLQREVQDLDRGKAVAYENTNSEVGTNTELSPGQLSSKSGMAATMLPVPRCLAVTCKNGSQHCAGIYLSETLSGNPAAPPAVPPVWRLLGTDPGAERWIFMGENGRWCLGGVGAKQSGAAGGDAFFQSKEVESSEVGRGPQASGLAWQRWRAWWKVWVDDDSLVIRALDECS